MVLKVVLRTKMLQAHNRLALDHSQVNLLTLSLQDFPI
jgi:hypothetical protein